MDLRRGKAGKVCEFCPCVFSARKTSVMLWGALIGSRLLAIALEGLLDLMERQGVSGKANSSRRSWAFLPRPLSLHCHWSQSQSPTQSLMFHSSWFGLMEGESAWSNNSHHFISFHHFRESPNLEYPRTQPRFFKTSFFFQTSRHLPLGISFVRWHCAWISVFFSHSDLDRSVDVLPCCQVSSLGRALCGLWLPRHRGEEGGDRENAAEGRRFAESPSTSKVYK